MDALSELWIKLIFSLKKYSLLILGLGWIILGSFVCLFPSSPDVSVLGGIAEIVAGVLSLAYFLYKKKQAGKK